MKTKLIYCLFVSMFFGLFQISAQQCEGFKTITQGGWGIQCHGGNPGCYRDANFDAAFPDGIRIGNETNSITLTSSLAVKNFLPSGTTPRALNSGALIDPGQTYKNVLAGQLVALTLSIGFDVYDANFGSNTLLLGSLEIRSGTFAGITVSEFLQIANDAIGGGSTLYTFSQLNSVASSINENFDGGTTDNGFLSCNRALILVSTLVTNPVCFGDLSGAVVVTITGGLGPYIYTLSNGATFTSSLQTVTFSGLAAGNYTVAVTDSYSTIATGNTSFTITQPSLLTSTFVQTNPTACTDNSASVIVTPAGGTAPYTILWSNGSTTFSLLNLIAGTYNYFITDASGCLTNGTATIIATPSLNTIHVTSDATCFGANNCSITTTVTGGTAPYTILWSNGSLAFSQTGLNPGIYTAVITDANGCQTTTSVTAIEPPVLQLLTVIGTTGTHPNNGSITATASGGTAPYTYLWSNGSTNPIQTNLAPGLYTCTVTDGFQCSTTLSALILLAVSDLLATAVVTNVSCFGGNNGSIVVTPSLGTSPYTILWDNGSTNFTLSNLIAGTYSAIVTDATGFTVAVSGTVTQPVLLLSNSNVFTNATCCTGNNGTIVVTPAGGTAPYTILWSNGSTAFSLDSLVGGIYTYVITDANGCTTSGSATIRAVPTLASTYVATPATCTSSNGTITVTASGGTTPYTILWANGSISFALTNLPNGTYSYTITDANGCQTNQVVNLVPLAPTLVSTYVTTLATCAGNDASITVTASGGTAPYTILWSNGSTTFTIGELAGGTYSYTVTDANGCTINGSVTITAIPLLLATATFTNVSCFAGNTGSATTTVTGGTAPYAILWSNGGTIFTINNLTAGTYTAVVTDANGCISNVSAIITQPATALAYTNATSNVSCFAGTNGSVTVTASGGTSPYTILWTGGATTFIRTNLTAGTYTAVVTDANGCTSNVSATITQPATALAYTNATSNVSCFAGTNGSVTVTATGGTSPYTILWTGGATTFTRTNLTAGTYSAVVTDAKGCILNVSATITQPATALAYTNATSNVSCFAGTNGSVTVTASGGTSPYTILWTGGATTFTRTNLTAGTYTAVVTDANGCISNVSATITQPATALASTNATSNVSCFAGTNGSVTVTATGGTSPYTILWTGGATTFTRTNLTAGTYSAVVTDAKGCTSNVSATITQPATALASTNATSNVSCFAGTNGSVTVTATGGTSPYTILWTSGATTFIRTNLTAGTYSAVVTDANGCTSNVSATITQPATALASTNATSNVSCFAGTNGSVTVTATGGTSPYTILWTGGATTFTRTNLTTGTYTAVVTDANGCTSNISATITQPTTALASTNATTNVSCFAGTNGSVTVTATGGTSPYNILWTGGATTFTRTNLTAGTYTAVVTDAKGCTSNVSATITQPATALAITMSQTPIVTSGGYGTATATVTGGTAPYTYSWDSTPIQTTQIASLQVGWYIVTVTDANGCTITGEVTLLFGYCKGFKTVTKRGYTANCYGENAACYLNVNFSKSFPNGILVGSGSSYLKFTSAEAIRNFISSESGPKVLALGTILNPSGSAYDNGLAAQVLATRLNVAFSRNADFSSNELSLGDLFITSGTFEGMKVSQVLTIANTLLGNGDSIYTMTEINNALIAINSNYVAGADMEFLRCTGKMAEVNPKPAVDLVNYMVYPNPVKDNATIEYTLNNSSSVSIKLYNITGQLVNTVFDGNVEAGDKNIVKFNADGMKSGVYFFRLTTNNTVATKSVIISQQ